MITVTHFSNSADDRSVDVQWIWIPIGSHPHHHFTLLYLYIELGNVRGVQERTCTQSTGVYTKYRECTRRRRLCKFVIGLQAFYELWHRVLSTRWCSVWHWVTTTIHIHMQSHFCLYTFSSRRTNYPGKVEKLVLHNNNDHFSKSHILYLPF